MVTLTTGGGSGGGPSLPARPAAAPASNPAPAPAAAQASILASSPAPAPEEPETAELRRRVQVLCFTLRTCGMLRMWASHAHAPAPVHGT